jgi:hypothetical protein
MLIASNSPSLIGAQTTIESSGTLNGSGIAVSSAETANLERRMVDIRARSPGFTMNSSSPSFGGGLSGPTGAEGKAGPSVLARFQPIVGVFLQPGFGEFTHVDTTKHCSWFQPPDRRVYPRC